MTHRWSLFSFFFSLFVSLSAQAQTIDLTHAVVVIRSEELPAAEKIAPTILTEEIRRRTGLVWEVTTHWPAQAEVVIAISTLDHPPAWKHQIEAVIENVPRKTEA